MLEKDKFCIEGYEKGSETFTVYLNDSDFYLEFTDVEADVFLNMNGCGVVEINKFRCEKGELLKEGREIYKPTDKEIVLIEIELVEHINW